MKQADDFAENYLILNSLDDYLYTASREGFRKGYKIGFEKALEFMTDKIINSIKWNGLEVLDDDSFACHWQESSYS